jgi:mannose-6-phosphate isomerase
MKVTPAFRERVWGREDIGFLYPNRPAAPLRVGEVWLTAEESAILDGPWKGALLGEAWRELGTRPDAPGAPAPSGRFPLLAKFLFTSDKLSVQVHPPDDFAARNEGGPGKTEMWHVMAAERGSRVAIGLGGVEGARAGDDLRAMAESGRIEAGLEWSDASEGDSFYVPAGTVHAVGAGLTVCEIQQYSDITYRLYDYGRKDSEGRERPLHVDKAVQVVRRVPGAGRLAPVEQKIPGGTRSLLAACAYFTTEIVSLHARAEFVAGGTPEIWIGLDGEARLDGDGMVATIRKGEAVVVAGRWDTLGVSPTPACRLIRTFRPDDADDPAGEWRRDGASGLDRVVFAPGPGGTGS